MVRSAAKNHKFVAIVTEPEQYVEVLDELQKHEGRLKSDFRRALAQKAFARTAAYDSAIATWMFEADRDASDENAPKFSESFSLAGTKVLDLRYG